MKKITKLLLSAVLALQIGFLLPMQTARADIVSDVIQLISDAAGWPTELPPVDALLALVDVAQKCSGDTSMDGLISCVEIADANPDIHNKLGDNLEKIKYGLELFQDITTGNYLGVLEKLGATIGCAAAVMITGVPVCAMAELIANLAGAVADAAKEIYAFLEDLGTYAVVQPQDFYDIHWYPKVPLGVQINVFAPNWEDQSKKFGDLTGPLYDVCYDFYKKNQNKTEGEATNICQWAQQKFVDEVNAEVAKLENNALALIVAAYDAKAVGWRKDWAPKCELSSGAAANIEMLIATCNQKVAAAIELGKTVMTVQLAKSCRIPDTLTYDTQNCAQSVYKNNKGVINALLAAVKDNQKLESDFKNNPNSAEKALGKLGWLSAQFEKEVGAWISLCKNNELNTPCRNALQQAWNVCNAQIAKVPPFKDIGPDPDKLQKVKSQCIISYNALISAYNKFSDKQSAMAALAYGCPKDGQGSGALFTLASEQCAKDVVAAKKNCSGGYPQITADFFSSGKLSQSPPGLDDCSDWANTFNGKWGLDEKIRGSFITAALTATGACNASGLPGSGCTKAIVAKVDDCKAKITKQANEVLGVIPGVPAYQAELSKAANDLIAAGNVCVQAILKVPENYLKNNAADVLALQMYGKQCPPNSGKFDYAAPCKAELLKTIDDCTRLAADPNVRPGGTLAEQQVADCKPKLQAVIDKYQKQYSALLDAAKAGAITTPVPTQPPAGAKGANAGALAGSLSFAAAAPVKMSKPDANHHLSQRKPKLEAPWITRCSSNACRNEVVRLIGNRLRDELDVLGTKIDPANLRAVETLYSELDMKYREPLNLALKKSDAAPATQRSAPK